MSTPHGSTARWPRRTAHPGTSAASGSDTVATRSRNGSAAVVIARERGWTRSVPCKVTACAPPAAAKAGQADSPKWACTTS